MNQSVLLSTAYLAPIPYYACMMHAPQLFVEQHEHYHKQTYRNRCRIVAANGVMDLSIPVITYNNQDIRKVEIDYSKPWQRQHWLSLEAAYRSTPFFEYYQDDLKPFYQQQDIRFLFDFNAHLQQVICDLIDLHPQIHLTQDFVAPGAAISTETDFLDLRDAIHPKKNLPEVLRYCSQKYTQVFEQQLGFVADMSIVDLLFNMGPESILLLRDSIQGEQGEFIGKQDNHFAEIVR